MYVCMHVYVQSGVVYVSETQPAQVCLSAAAMYLRCGTVRMRDRRRRKGEREQGSAERDGHAVRDPAETR